MVYQSSQCQPGTETRLRTLVFDSEPQATTHVSHGWMHNQISQGAGGTPPWKGIPQRFGLNCSRWILDTSVFPRLPRRADAKSTLQSYALYQTPSSVHRWPWTEYFIYHQALIHTCVLDSWSVQRNAILIYYLEKVLNKHKKRCPCPLFETCWSQQFLAGQKWVEMSMSSSSYSLTKFSWTHGEVILCGQPGPPTGSAEWSIANTVRAGWGAELNYLRQASGLASQKDTKGSWIRGQGGKYLMATLGGKEDRRGKAMGSPISLLSGAEHSWEHMQLRRSRSQNWLPGRYMAVGAGRGNLGVQRKLRTHHIWSGQPGAGPESQNLTYHSYL